VPHARVEKALRASALDWTFVRPSFFMQNLSTTHRQRRESATWTSELPG
jgi:uncharacterized protein YbjT (DUF2867 family)